MEPLMSSGITPSHGPEANGQSANGISAGPLGHRLCVDEPEPNIADNSLTTLNFFVGPLLLACGVCGALVTTVSALQPNFPALPSLRDFELVSLVLSLLIVGLGLGSVVT